MQRLHIDRDPNPVQHRRLHVLVLQRLLASAANLLQVQIEIGFQFFHVELKVACFRQFMHFLNEEHRVVFVRCHEQVVISQAHQAIKFKLRVDAITLWVWLARDQLSPQELALGIFQVRIVETREDVRDTETLRDAFSLPELLLVEGDEVVAADVLKWLQQIFF